MHLELLIPDLIAPDAEAARGLKLPALELLLGRGIRQEDPALSLEDWLCTAAALPDDQAAPIAAISLLGDGGSPGSFGWLRADPVNLRVERDQLVLDALPAATLTHDDAAALVATLNAHFAADGMRFCAANSRKWYVQMANAPDVELTSLSAASGRNIDEVRPRGHESMRWQGIANEVQMLLHEHAVNEAREARGDAPINSVWFWGAGANLNALSSPPDLRFQKIWSDDALARGIALLAGKQTAPCPASAAQLFERMVGTPGTAHHLVELDALRVAAREQGVDAWRAMLKDFERDWFAPVLAAMRRSTGG